MVIKCVNVQMKKIFAVLRRGALLVTHTHPSAWSGSNVDLWSRSFYSRSPREC